MTEMEKIIERVRKLHAKAESCKEIGSIEEAATFAAAVEKMLATHKLTMSQLEIEREAIEDPIGGQRFNPADWGLGRKQQRIAWQEYLASGVARAHFCEILVVPGSNVIVFVGRGADREVAVFMYTTLARKCDELAKAAYHLYWRRTKILREEEFVDGYVANFKQGFVRAINERYGAIARAREAAAKQAGTSLIRLDEAHAAVKRYVKEQSGGRAGAVGGGGTRNDAGARDGHRAGSSVPLHGTGVKGGGATTASRLCGGQKLLGGK